MRSKYEVHLVTEDGPQQRALAEQARWLSPNDVRLTVEAVSPQEAKASARVAHNGSSNRVRLPAMPPPGAAKEGLAY